MEITPDYKSPRSLFASILSLPTWHALRTHALTQLGWTESRRLGRSVNRSGEIPWWPYSLTHYLDQMVSPDATVLEIGGGASTAWWLKRGNHVTTLETDPKWISEIENSCSPWKHRHKLMCIPSAATEDVVGVIRDERFQIVVNDGPGDRAALSTILAAALTDSGMLIWDNSDRQEYEESMNALAQQGWSQLHFFGMSPISAYASRSTIFYRNVLVQSGNHPKFETVRN